MSARLPVATRRAIDPGQLAASARLAGWVGPIAIVVSLSEALNLRIWATSDPRLTYMAGILWFVAGLAVVKVHNRWSYRWPVAMTILGWFLLIGGLFRMFLPTVQQGNANTPELGTYLLDVVLLAVGLILTIKSRDDRS